MDRYLELIKQIINNLPHGSAFVVSDFTNICDYQTAKRTLARFVDSGDIRRVIWPDSDFPKQTMARCKPNDRGGYTIEIRETVYRRAYKLHSGPDLGFICHELCHIFPFSKGFVPIFERSFKSNTLRPFESVEWQAKHLCGEVMIPYKESIGMTKQEIIDYYHVSKSYANSRLRME